MLGTFLAPLGMLASTATIGLSATPNPVAHGQSIRVSESVHVDQGFHGRLQFAYKRGAASCPDPDAPGVDIEPENSDPGRTWTDPGSSASSDGVLDSPVDSDPADADENAPNGDLTVSASIAIPRSGTYRMCAWVLDLDRDAGDEVVGVASVVMHVSGPPNGRLAIRVHRPGTRCQVVANPNGGCRRPARLRGYQLVFAWKGAIATRLDADIRRLPSKRCPAGPPRREPRGARYVLKKQSLVKLQRARNKLVGRTVRLKAGRYRVCAWLEDVDAPIAGPVARTIVVRRAR